MKPKKIILYASISILLIAIYSVVPYPTSKNLKFIDNTTFWWIISCLILYIYWRAKTFFFDSKLDGQNMKYVMAYIIWNLFSIIRGLFIADNYWDWKGLLTNGMALTLPIVAFSATNLIFSQAILSFSIKYALPVFFVIAGFMVAGAYGFYLVPISFLMLFLPAFNLKSKLILFSVTLIVVLADFGARSNVIKFVIPFLLLGFLFVKNTIVFRLLEVGRNVLFIVPFLLLFLATMDIFNPFQMDKYIKSDYQQTEKDENGNYVQSSLKDDTRTFLYVEVLRTAKKFNSWFIGRSPARGNETEVFVSSDLTGRKERLTNEVAILNIFTWTGIIGVFLYMLVFYRASYLAVNNSNNVYAKISGIYISFRWVYAWVEDINIFTLTTFMLWFILGLAFSTSFRKMSDKEVSFWVRGFFEKKYRLAYYRLLRNSESKTLDTLK